jgi:hypothetical protein
LARFAAIALLATLAVACDDGGNGNGNGAGPGPSPGTNPCASVADAPALTVESAEAAAKASALASAVDDSTPWRVLDDVYAHRAAVARRTLSPARVAGDAADVGEIAVLQNEGDLIINANRFDLGGVGLRYSRNGAGGYSVARTDAAFRGTLGTRLTLSDDDSESVTVGFAFPFYNGQHTNAFVNSDGNVTFVEEDRASTERNVSRLLTGPPRVAPFLADLDPSVGGSVWVNSTAAEFTVTWCAVRGFDSAEIATLQVTLLPDGTVEMKHDPATTLDDAVVGVSPGRTGNFRPIDLSAAGPTDGGGAAVGERFSESAQLDTVATARRFYQTHADAYDQLVIWTDTRVLTDAFAYETTVANGIRGVGQDVFDLSEEFGSAGALSSIVVMDALTKYPDDPRVRALRENSTLSLLGHETGHRWLALLEFRDHNGQRSQALLGRDQVHWSFFFDSDASFLEGNDIEDLGGGAFRTRETVSRYSRLDLYAMGLARSSEVPAFFYVDSPTNTTREPADPPTTNVTFNGTRRVVLLQDVQAIHGPRQPSSDNSPRLHRQAFIYIITTPQPSSAQVAKLDRIRREWEPFFNAATERRMVVETVLR